MEVKKGHFLTHLSPEWHSAHAELLENVRQNPFTSQYQQSTHANLNGKKVYLPAYIPYIGHYYFEYRPRILCYAINQNLSPHVKWSKEWINNWATDIEHAYDRLNRAAYENKPIPIKPYTEGFIPLIATLATQRWIRTFSGNLPNKIDDVVAVTNFIKFSTANDASSSSIPNIWWKECGSLYAEHEIQLLQPDIIISFGQKTSLELIRVLKRNRLNDHKIQLLECRFPARIPSIKGRPLTSQELQKWNKDFLPLTKKICSPKKDSYHRCKILDFPGYFIDVISSWDCAD